MLKVDTRGFAELQAGRPAWSFVRELVSNAWDEDISICTVDLNKEGNKPVQLIVTDDGPGFRDLRDAYTLFGHTPKRKDPNVRGRFNLGEKELAVVAKEMWIQTTSGGIHFTKDRRLRKTLKPTAIGTHIEAHVSWTKQEVTEILEMLERFIPPTGTIFIINGVTVEPMSREYSLEGTLPTVIFKDGAMRLTKRKTRIWLYVRLPRDSSWLYELGIPIQPIDCPFHVNVQQKVPLAPNRENVSDAYLRDIYAYVLNSTIEDIDDLETSETWVRSASEDEIVSTETITRLREKRYKDAVLWSSELEANQRAVDEGIEVIHPRTLAAVEQGRFQEVGMQHSSALFGAGAAEVVDYVPHAEWTTMMREQASLAIWVYRRLYDESLRVEYADLDGREAAFGRGGLLLRGMGKERMADSYLKQLPQFLALLGHEFGHRKGLGHDADWRMAALETTGQIIKLFMDEPDGFIKEE